MRALFEAGGEGGAAVSVALLTEPGEVGRLIGVLEAVADEQGWRPGGQLRDYRDAALHLAVLVGEGIAGGLQAVIGEGHALPCRRLWPQAETGDGLAAHVTILALEREYRGRPHLFGPLCAELWRCCVARGVAWIVIEATPPTLRLYRRIGWPLEVIGGLRMHWGEECYLCRMGVPEVADALSEKARRSAAHRTLVEHAYRDGPAAPPLTGPAFV